MHKTPLEERSEELLELIWVMREDGETAHAALVTRAARAGEDHPDLVLGELARRGLVTGAGGVARAAARGGAPVELTAAGEAAASSIVRRHRLAERLLHDVLDLDAATSAADACRFEHVLSPEVTTSICTLLGHPPTCPHGRAIPRGDCCGTYETSLRPLVIRLADLGVGERATVTFVEGRVDGLERLGALGLVPGVNVRLAQRRPAHVVEVGETAIAVDARLAMAINVKRST
jgi:DtxR family Mn-dependent transcriptional regulator